MEMWQVVITVATTVFGSSALFGFIQYMLDRKDKKNKHIKDIEGSISDLNIQLNDSISSLNTKIDAVSFKIDLRCATDARTRILRAADEMRHGMDHSEEFFDQLHEDISLYETYCKIHEDFKNNKAVNAINYINQIYQKRLEKDDFL